MRPPTKPFDHGTIFTVLNLHGGLQASGSFARLRRQARLSGKAGLDGVCLSEHHGVRVKVQDMLDDRGSTHP
jgi:hypothetical protein